MITGKIDATREDIKPVLKILFCEHVHNVRAPQLAILLLHSRQPREDKVNDGAQKPAFARHDLWEEFVALAKHFVHPCGGAHVESNVLCASEILTDQSRKYTMLAGLESA